MSRPSSEKSAVSRGEPHLPHNRAELWRSGPVGPLLGLLAVVVLFTVLDATLSSGAFATVRNLRVVLTTMATTAVAALGMTLVIIAGGIDLSVGTALTLCATLCAWCFKQGYGTAEVLAATLACGCACGMFNGLLVSTLRIVPFIVTLGTMTVFLGIGKIVSSETTIFPPRDAIPTWLHNWCSSQPPDLVFGFVPNIPRGILFAALLALIVGAILRYTIFGRHVFAVGSNEATARLCGVHVPATKVAVYTLAGLLTAVAGVYHFSRLKIGNPTEGQGMELDIIAAVVIGGGSLSGGRGSIAGTLTGAAIMAVIRSGCDQLEVRTSYQHIVVGAIIISAAALDQWRQRRAAAE